MIKIAHEQESQAMLHEDSHSMEGTYHVTTEAGENIGYFHDYVFDKQGVIRYIEADTRYWISGKRILIPAGLIEIQDDAQKIIVKDFTRYHVEALPPFYEEKPITEELEEKILEVLCSGEPPILHVNGDLDYERYPIFNAPQRLKRLRFAV